MKELKTAGINYENAKTTLENSKLQLDKTRIIAPIDGVIVDLPYYTQGTQVETGSSIAKIMDYRVMYMDVQLPEKYIAIIKPGQQVKLTNYTLPEDTIIGSITQFSPAINPDTRTFKGNISINNPGYLLRPGMFVKADIVTDRQRVCHCDPKRHYSLHGRGEKRFLSLTAGLQRKESLRRDLKIPGMSRSQGASQGMSLLLQGVLKHSSNKSKVKIIK